MSVIFILKRLWAFLVSHYTEACPTLTSNILKLDKHVAPLAIRASNVDYKA